MRIDENLRSRLLQAAEALGGAGELAKRCGMNAANISRYLNGKVKFITDDNWEKLESFLKPASDSAAPGTIANTPALQRFIRAEMKRNGIPDAESLRRLIHYDSIHTVRRLLDGELNWFPDVLSALLDALGCDRDKVPLAPGEKNLLAPGGIYRDGAMLVRPVPVVDWANAASDLESLVCDAPTVNRHWDTENTETVPVPVGDRQDIRAFKVHGISMEPRILDDDVVLVEPAYDLAAIPNNKIVVVRLLDSAEIGENVVCKRFRRQENGIYLLTSDNPEGKIIPLDPANVGWIGIVVRKISEL